MTGLFLVGGVTLIARRLQPPPTIARMALWIVATTHRDITLVRKISES